MKKRILALILGVVMVASSLTACGKKDSTDSDQGTTAGTTAAGTQSSGSENDSTTTATYTYNDYVSGSPATWNPHEWETNSDAYIMDYTQLGLYSFYLNDAKDGYKIVPGMAAADPEDITATLAGNETYGIPADATEGYAFRIALRQDACWEDGTPITSEDYVYSMQQMLSSEIKNYRASSYYEGQLALANAKNYANNDVAGQPKYESIGSMGYASVDDAVAAGVTDLYIDMEGAWAVTDEDGNNIFSITDENKLRDEAVEEGEEGDYISPKEVYDGYFANGMANAAYQADYIYAQNGVYEATAWENVGLYAEDDYTIVLVLTSPISDFYLYYNLSSNWLVKKDLYEANMTQTGDIKKTTYGTSVDTYMSYGPYKLTEYQVDKQITMEKNDTWFGYSDPAYEGLYQTTKINTQVVETHATALQMFLKGELDNVGLDAEDMETYRTSDFVMYTPESYTSKLTFNCSKEALETLEETAGANINMTMLAYEDFRHAIALSIDRTAFAEQCTATHQPGYGLLNYMYVYDPESGALYRDSELAKQALCEAYGVSDESEITGFDKVQAAALYTKAYNDAIAAGDLKEGDTVQINFHMYKSDDAYKKMFNFIEAGILEAAKGTPFEGKIKLEFVEDPDYYDNAMTGKTGIIFSTWGGSSMDPFGIMQCYVDPTMYHEYGFDHEADLTLTVNGEEITKSWYDWYDALCNGEYKLADVDTRLEILAGFESAYLQTYVCTPMYYRTSASLCSRKVTYATDSYVQLVGFGGIAEMTYNYTDEEWAAYLAENNNQLTY
ncbi:MAG: hypothetical protein J6B85_01300 [Lachnospiraceae bacterium]|nr:hypothetical protein [Lachnospiraceae bacterium]